MGRLRVQLGTRSLLGVLTPMWYVLADDGHIVGRFTMWREALHHADRVARTLNGVVLPRLEEDCEYAPTGHGGFAPISITHHDNRMVKIAGPIDTVAILDTELVPVAKYLLAIAHERGQLK